MQNISKEQFAKKLIAVSTLAWIKNEGIVNEKGKPIEFYDHPFLIDIYADQAQEIVVQKGSQIGVSTWAILDAIHDAKYQGINQIHTLPTATDVTRFVPSKVNLIIKNNPSIFRDISGDIDAVTQKQIGKAFIFYRGTFSEREAIMLSSDKNIIDELDKSDMGVVRDYNSRLGASELAKKRFISTPTIPNFGINRLFDLSDQKHWRFNCPKCKFRQHMEWEKNVDFENKIYVCQKCHNEITANTIRCGEWEARYPGRETSGYWIPQMIATYRTCADLIKELEDAEDEEYFYNFVLGVPYLNPEARIPGTLIYKNLTNEKHNDKAKVMGVDVGKQFLHVIGGNEKGVFIIAEIEDKVGKTKWERLGELVDVYDTQFCLIDGGWDTNSAYNFARKTIGKTYLAWYKEDPSKASISRWGDDIKFTDKLRKWEESVRVLIDRNRSIDLLISDLRKGKIRFNFQIGDSSIEELVDHIQTMYSRTVTDKHGKEKREWASTTGNDHFLHALNYFNIALNKYNDYKS